VRDFESLADYLIPRRKKIHFTIIVASILMVPGIIASFEPIDIESYDMESPELDANQVLREEFTTAGNIWGFGIFVRDPSHFGEPDSDVTMIAKFPGVKGGISEPRGGILNLTVLREIDHDASTMRESEISEFYLPLASEISGDSAYGILDLATEFRTFMANQSSLTSPRINPYKLAATLDINASTDPAPTNWTNCGQLDCLSFDDPNVTQDHIDLAAHRMANNSNGAFLRFLSNDRAFLPDEKGAVVGPVGHQVSANGSLISDNWQRGRWSASAAWMIVNFDRDEMQQNGWTFTWKNASSEFGYEWNGLDLETKPIHNSVEVCRQREEVGQPLCSVEWLYLSLEEDLRESDEMIISLMFAESINVEINRELISSAFLILLMGFAILILLWASLRRVSDVGIVATSLVLSLVWMYGLIGWAIILGKWSGNEIIFRSQFSNLLPILILALEIDDSLHSLHRYKEERRLGANSEQAVHKAISKVGLAIMLTSVTTIVAFMANMTSSIAALRSFGIEAGIGVFCAFFLTGLWVPLARLDIDLWLETRGRLDEERKDIIHMIPSSWLSFVSTQAARYAPVVLIVSLLITALATPIMLSLEGDFQVEDFIEADSDLAVGVGLINERFSDEGEPAYILIEGNISNPLVLDAIDELRRNMNSHGPDDPDQISRMPNGDVELIGIDLMLWYTRGAMAWNQTPFEQAGWDFDSNDGGIGCKTLQVPNREMDFISVPSIDDSRCLSFLYGFMLTRGVPASGGYPSLSTSIVGEFIQVEGEIDFERPWLTKSGDDLRFPRTSLRFGISSPEQFALVEPALKQLEEDLSPIQNLSVTPNRERGDLQSAFVDQEHPVTWAIPTGEPVIRFVAADSMQDDLQDTLLLGLVFCIMALWWGFREDSSTLTRLKDGWREPLQLVPRIVLNVITMSIISYFLAGPDYAVLFALLTVVFSILWGTRPLVLATITTAPIFLMIVWLYAIVGIAGYGLNMVTVSIAAISLGVGIDYVIHIIERFREEKEKGTSTMKSIEAVGGASGIALFGSAVSDITGFAIINQSEMGFFSTFGLFCAIMIGLSLVASLILTPAALGLAYRDSKPTESEASIA
tara:strand:- start:11117 stop:14395 length:3279 start_codon:yes stop_codon:yes gene_type:complete